MNITKTPEFMLFKNDKGEYHLSHELYEELGEEKSKELAEKEIEKKLLGGNYSKDTINFEQARDLGFCEYGIKDFAKRLELDVEGEYTIKELYSKLDVHTFTKYPQECIKLFTNKVFDKFGGIKKILNENRSQRSLNLVINYGNIDDKILHTFAYKSAMRVVDNYEKVYPNDNIVRNAIEAKKKFIDGLIDEKELNSAESAAWSAWSAAWSADSADSADSAESAESAARSAAWSAKSAWSAKLTAYSAAWSAVYSAESAAYSAGSAELARSAEIDFQIDTLISLMER